MPEFRALTHGSEPYLESVALRDRVLRQPLGLCFSPEELAAESAQQHLALLQEGQVVAVVVAQPQENGWTRLRQMAVEPRHQGQGLGARLLATAEEYLAEQGRRQWFLHAREGAVGFYARCGYQARGEPFREVGIVHQRMEKTL